MSKYEKAARRDIEREDEEKPARLGLCRAFGCPERGTISHSNVGPAGDSDWYCRFHFGVESHLWPEITRERMKAKDRGVKTEPLPELEVRRTSTGAIDIEHYRRALRSFAGVGAVPSKDWAWRLKQREEGGESISEVQRSAWRVALRNSAPTEVSLES